MNEKCYFCESVETRFCKLCKKWLCRECRENYPKRIAAFTKNLFNR